MKHDIMHQPHSNIDSHIKLAKAASEYYVMTRQVLTPTATLPASLAKQRACYVYIFENPGRRLRTVYGELLPRQPSLAQEIVTNTVTALSSHHFRSIRRADLSSLSYTIAVLDTLQRVSDAVQLQPRRFGLHIRSDSGKSAALLPQRAGIETAQDQIATALRESGINPHQEAVTMYRFDVTFYD